MECFSVFIFQVEHGDMNPFDLEKIYDDFESAWRCRERPSIDEYLSRIDETEQATIIRELFALELIYRMQLGESPNLADYAQRFAKFYPVLEEVFREVISHTNGDQQVTG